MKGERGTYHRFVSAVSRRIGPCNDGFILYALPLYGKGLNTRKAASLHGTLARPRIMGKLREAELYRAVPRYVMAEPATAVSVSFDICPPDETYFRSFASAHVSPLFPTFLHFSMQPCFYLTFTLFWLWQLVPRDCRYRLSASGTTDGRNV